MARLLFVPPRHSSTSRAGDKVDVRSFGARHPRSEIFYASKACSNLWFLNVVRDAGINIEVNSGGELEKALRAGFAPRQIVFIGVAKTRVEIAAAVKVGVRALLVDSLHELGRIAAVAAEVGRTAAVAPRIDVQPEVCASTIFCAALVALHRLVDKSTG